MKIKQRNIVKDSQGRLMVMGRNTTLVVLDEDGTERAVHRLPYGTHLRVDDGVKVKRGDRLAEWDPYTRPVLTEIDGIIDFEDLVEGVSVSERRDESTGITNSVIIDWRASPRGVDLRPAVVLKDKKGKIGKLSRGGEARYLLPVEAILSVEHNHEVKAGDVLARIPTESAKTRDITGGLPRVAELFEARRPKDHAIIAEMSGTVQLGRDYKNKRRITIVPDDGEEPVEYLIPKGRHLSVQEGDRIEKGEYLLDGHPAPHDILAIKGVEELANYLVNEIQEVYRLQGVTINDKHIEVIVRQMLQKIEIEDPGSTDYLKGEQVDRLDLDDANTAVEAAGGKPATGQPVLLGITKASLQTRSFHLGGLFPGDHARAHRRGGQWQDGRARGPEGERHRRAADSGGHRRHAHAPEQDRLASGRPHPRGAAARRRRAVRAGGRGGGRGAGDGLARARTSQSRSRSGLSVRFRLLISDFWALSP